MNAVAPISPAKPRIPDSPLPMPTPPVELAQKLATFDGMELVRGTVPAVVVAQAKAYLALLEAYHAAPPPLLIEFWLRKLRGGVAAISDDDFEGRCEAVQAVCGDLPGWVWTADTLCKAWRKFTFFPAASQVYDLVAPIVFRRTLGLSQVRMLAAATPESGAAGQPRR